MTASAKKLMARAMTLSTDDRAAMAAELLASLDGESDEDVEVAWAAEIHRRVQRVAEGKAKFEDWNVVRNQLRPKA